MPLEVIGAGLGRTGTLSLKVALEELGFVRCYHMTEVFANPAHVAQWESAARGEAVDWEALFQGYRATVDWPGCNFYREFLERYPDAKVILTVRDPEKWHASALATIYSVRTAFPSWLKPFLPPARFLKMADRLIWNRMFDGRFEDKDHAIAVYHRHNDEVRRLVPPEKLLVYEVREGWAPLCTFLGIPIPEGKPFPHVNDTAEFRTRFRRMSRIMTTIAYAVIGFVALILAGLVVWWMR